LIRCGGRPNWWRISITISPLRISAPPNGVATVSFFNFGRLEKSRLVPPIMPSIQARLPCPEKEGAAFARWFSMKPSVKGTLPRN